MCDERERLLEDFRSAIENLTTLVFASRASNCAESNETQKWIEGATADGAKARTNLHEHMEQHACWTHSACSALLLWHAPSIWTPARRTSAGTGKSQAAA